MTNFLYKNDLPDDLDLGNSIAIDTEAMGLRKNRDRLCVVQISKGDGNAHLVQIEKGSFDKSKNLKKLLSDDNVLKIFHFARFDLALLNVSFDIEIRNVYCTKIASKLVRTYTDHHGLKSLAHELIGVEMSKKQQSSDWGVDEISNEQIKYAASDVLYLHQIKEKLDEMLVREERQNLAQECFNFLGTRA
ncbi:MAG: ribonuclease H-like domain-containing protein, partial [Proteobacteria bacterium]|nr:ribonuclease H-like domain-containing protein [Pseudomonadota bacterium]